MFMFRVFVQRFHAKWGQHKRGRRTGSQWSEREGRCVGLCVCVCVCVCACVCALATKRVQRKALTRIPTYQSRACRGE